MSVRIADILKLPTLHLAHILVGSRGMGREVEYVDVLESPDIDVIIKPRVLYLTSGFVFRDNERLQRLLLSRLQDTGAAGLLVEQGRYLTPLPQHMIETADRLRFPIIELPHGAAFPDVIRESLKLIFEQQGDALRRSQEIQKRLTEVAASGGSLQQIAQTMANLVCNTVIVADRSFSLLSFAFWEKEHKNAKRKAYVGNTLDQYLYNLEKTGFIDRIRQDKKTSRVEVIFSKQGEQAWVVVPVIINGEILGYIAVLEDYHRLSEAEWAALEQAASITAIAVYKQVAEEEVVRRQRNDFLLQVLSGVIVSAEMILEQAKRLQISLEGTWAVLQIEVTNFAEYLRGHFPPGADEAALLRQKVLAMLATQLTAKQRDLLVAFKSDRLTVLCPARDWQSKEAVLQRVAEIRLDLGKISPELEFAIGISRICDSAAKLSQAYREAKDTLLIGRKLDASKADYLFSDLGIYQILMQFKAAPEMREYYQSILGKLDQLDAATRCDLLKTLEAYFAANANIYKAAQNLYLHRNSMKYRLERIKEMLAVDLDEPEIRFNVQLALKIRHLL